MAAKKKAVPARRAPAQSTQASGPWAAVFAPRAKGEMRAWLVKSEPDVFSWDDLLRAPKRTTCWDGVRNHAARNFMRDAMRIGDRVFFYHSNAEPPAIVGICEVVSAAYPDATAFDRRHDGYDEKSVRDDPTWYMVDLRAVEALPRAVTLPMIKAVPSLAQMALLRVGRLSVTPVSAAEWDVIVALATA